MYNELLKMKQTIKLEKWELIFNLHVDKKCK